MVAKEQGRSFPSPTPSLGSGVFSGPGQGRVEDVTCSAAARECGVRRPSPRVGEAAFVSGRGRELGDAGTPTGCGPGPLDRRRVQLAPLGRRASVMGYKRGGKYFSLLSRFALSRSLLVRR